MLRSAVRVRSTFEKVLSASAVHTGNVARIVSKVCIVGRTSTGHLLTAVMPDPSMQYVI